MLKAVSVSQLSTLQYKKLRGIVASTRCLNHPHNGWITNIVAYTKCLNHPHNGWITNIVASTRCLNHPHNGWITNIVASTRCLNHPHNRWITNIVASTRCLNHPHNGWITNIVTAEGWNIKHSRNTKQGKVKSEARQKSVYHYLYDSHKADKITENPHLLGLNRCKVKKKIKQE